MSPLIQQVLFLELQSLKTISGYSSNVIQFKNQNEGNLIKTSVSLSDMQFRIISNIYGNVETFANRVIENLHNNHYESFTQGKNPCTIYPDVGEKKSRSILMLENDYYHIRSFKINFSCKLQNALLNFMTKLTDVCIEPDFVMKIFDIHPSKIADIFLGKVEPILIDAGIPKSNIEILMIGIISTFYSSQNAILQKITSGPDDGRLIDSFKDDIQNTNPSYPPIPIEKLAFDYKYELIGSGIFYVHLRLLLECPKTRWACNCDKFICDNLRKIITEKKSYNQ